MPNPNVTKTTTTTTTTRTEVDPTTQVRGFKSKEVGSNASLARSGQSQFPPQSSVRSGQVGVEDEFKQQVENMSEPEDDPALEEKLVREGKLQSTGQSEDWFSLPISNPQRKETEDYKRHFAEDVQEHETELEAQEEFADLDVPTHIKMKQKLRSGMESAKETMQEGMRKIKQKTVNRDHVRDSPEARLKQGDVRRHAEDVQQQQIEDETRQRDI